MDNIMTIVIITVKIIYDQASKNGLSWHKIHHITKW